MKTKYQIFVANLINVVGLIIMYMTIDMIIATNNIFATKVSYNDVPYVEDMARLVWYQIRGIALFPLHTSVIWIPFVFVGWMLDYIFLIELKRNKYIVIGLECSLFFIPVIWLWSINFSLMNLSYPLLIVSAIITHCIKIIYLSKKGILK